MSTQADRLLIYRVEHEWLTLVAVRTETHSAPVQQVNENAPTFIE